MKKINKVPLMVAICLATYLTPAYSQQTDGSNATRHEYSDDDHDDGFNMGWLGLIGVVGLIGLRRRDKEDPAYRSNPTAR